MDALPAQARFDRPVAFALIPGSAAQALIAEQKGVLWLVPLDEEATERRQVLDLGARVLSYASGGHNEEGLLGLACDPGFAGNRHVWLYYSERVQGKGRQSVVARLDAVVEDGAFTRVDPETELRVLEVEQPAGNHNGGDIVFGPDGMLHIALGDGGASGDRFKNGQDLTTLLASILRIDVRGATSERPYAIPPDNPFTGKDAPAGARGEIWAYGLRNPWQIAFDRETGELWCGDVGQDRYEEVDRIQRGGNHGWPIMEGFHPFARDATEREREGLVPPIAEYGRDQGVSITGGAVYRGKSIPDLVGRYVYADFATGRIWAVSTHSKDGRHDVELVAKQGVNIAAFAEDARGELLCLSFDGRIRRIVPAAPGKRPGSWW